MRALRFATYLAPSVRPLYAAAVRAIGEATGAQCLLEDADDYGRFRDDLYDAAFICSLPYVVLERDGFAPAVPVAAPILTGDRYEGRPDYFSDVIVRADSGYRTFDDLRGCRWAYNEILSQSGYGITRYHLLRTGRIDGFFGDVVAAGFHDRAIEMVVAGDVDASAIDSQVLAIALVANPALRSSLRVIESLGPSTIQPIVVSKRLDDRIRNTVTRVLVELHDDAAARPTMESVGVERFVPVGPDDYDDIREMVDACEDAGFLELR